MGETTCDVPLRGAPSEEPQMGSATPQVREDPVEQVARIATSRRAWLLRIHRRRLRHEDLEDCYSQATLELLARAQRDPFASREHVLNALEQKFRSRIEDRRRAIGGRSAIESAIAQAVPVEGIDGDGADLEDRGATVERQVFVRSDIRRLREAMADLSRDQQLVLAGQVLADMDSAEFCRRYGWSTEKYRKVAQRARARLRVLMDEYECGGRCTRLEPDVLALASGAAHGDSLARARAHVENCTACARMVGRRERPAGRLTALAPLPAAWLAGAWSSVRRSAASARHPFARVGGSGGAGVAGGSLAGAGAIKVGIAAICVAGTVGGYAACAHLGVLADLAGSVATPTHHGGSAPPRSVPRRIAAVRHVVPAPSVTTQPTHREAPAQGRLTPTSAIAQVRREFGAPPARASSGAPPLTIRLTATAASAAMSPQTSAQVRQTTAEFGFER